MVYCVPRVFLLYIIIRLGTIHGSGKPVQQPQHPASLAAKPLVILAYRKKLPPTISLDLSNELVDVPLGNVVKPASKPITQKFLKDSSRCEGFCSIQ